MLALLLYCYSHGILSSRPIERAAYKDVAIRYLCGNTHPDHNTICLFRSRNENANLIAKLQEREIDVILPLVAEEVRDNRKYDSKPESLRKTNRRASFRYHQRGSWLSKLSSENTRESQS